LQLALKNLALLIRLLNPEARRKQHTEITFDAEIGVDTGGYLRVQDLGIEKEIARHCVHYEPTRVWLFEEVFSSISVNYKDYIMVDIGSGKGRVLILASKFPFKKIIGVEISKHLHEIATKNIATYSNTPKKCNDIRSFHLNAVYYNIPDENIIMFLYNPFDDFFLHKLLDKIEKHHQSSGKRIIIIYINPVHRETIEQYTFLEPFKYNKRYIIYRNNI
jgi:SAM-dependent methyltransferase